MPPVSPMLARAADSLSDVAPGDMWVVPKWDGFRAVIFRDGDEVEIGSRNERSLARYFPELPGAPNRWRSGTGTWVPLAGAPVAEVTYDGILSGRFRHSARLMRWRPDRLPESCTEAQIVRNPPVELAKILGAAQTL